MPERKALLYKLPNKNYKYTKQELAELLNVYVSNGWLPMIKQKASSYLDGGMRSLFFVVGMFPIFFISYLCIYSVAGGSSVIDPVQTEPTISTGGIIMASFILTIFVILGIIGIITSLTDLSSDSNDRDAQEIIGKELNAHTQILKALNEDNATLLEERDYYKNNYDKLEGKFETLYHDYNTTCSNKRKAEQRARKLENKILDLETKIAKMKHASTKRGTTDTEPEEGLGMYEEV